MKSQTNLWVFHRKLKSLYLDSVCSRRDRESKSKWGVYGVIGMSTVSGSENNYRRVMHSPACTHKPFDALLNWVIYHSAHRFITADDFGMHHCLLHEKVGGQSWEWEENSTAVIHKAPILQLPEHLTCQSNLHKVPGQSSPWKAAYQYRDWVTDF